MNRALVWTGVWTLVGLGFTLQLYLAEARFVERPESWWHALRATLPDWYLWGLLWLGAVQLARRIRVERGDWGRHLPIYAGVCLWLAFLHLLAAIGLQAALRAPTGEAYPLVDRLVSQFAASFHWNVVICAAILAGAHAREYYRDLRAHRIEKAELSARLAEARLQVLGLQLRPHFLFNALNAIAELVHVDPDAADRSLTSLAELLRWTLDAHGGQEVALEREMALVDRYLGLQQLRFHDRLSVRFDVAEETRAARVPALILLTLVENAVRHGLSAAPEPGEVGVRTRRRDDALLVEVWDTGGGPSGEARAPGDGRVGIGLGNTRERLQHLYGAAHRLDFDRRPAGGLVVRLEIPFRAAA